MFFADIDLDRPGAGRLGWAVFALLAVVAIAVGIWQRSALEGWGLLALSAIVSPAIATFVRRSMVAARGGMEQMALRRVDEFMSRHADWGVRLYRTPAGLRLLATHGVFDPRDPAVERYLNELGADPVFTRMCLRQNCFRARVSPKPWRIGIAAHLRPRTGVWPIAPDKLPLRQSWVEAYETAAVSHAACRFLKTLGTAMIHVDVSATQQLHDELCRADSNLPIA